MRQEARTGSPLPAGILDQVRLWRFAIVAAGAAFAVFAADGEAAPRLARSEACASCHAQIAAEWRASLHHQSFTDPVFQRGYALERQAFCRACHAPAADARREPPPDAADEGVGCTSCHVPSDRAPARGAHPVLETRRSASACAGCHQFAFPENSHAGEGALMQRTVAEWQSSAWSGKTCATCHMPEVVDPAGRHASHAFAARDPDVLRSALHATAARVAPGRIEIALGAAGAGHAFPTGDMFRRLEVRAVAIDERGEVIETARPQLLARTFRDEVDRDARGNAIAMRVEGPDLRLGTPGGPGATRVVALAVRDASRRVRWEVAYQRVLGPPGAPRGLGAPVDEVVVASGLLPAEEVR
jgi:hypothetical protein